MQLDTKIVQTRCGFTIRSQRKCSAHVFRKGRILHHILTRFYNFDHVYQKLSIKLKIKDHFRRGKDFRFCLVAVARESAQRFLDNQHLSEKRPMDPLPLPNQRQTKTAFETGFFVARQRDFFPGGGGDLEVKRVPFIRTEGQGWPLKDKDSKWGLQLPCGPYVKRATT